MNKEIPFYSEFKTFMTGTGKSFIGAIFAKAIHNSTKQNILVVCYTNHALDQFLEDLMEIGIPQHDIVRMGGKSTSATEKLLLHNQPAKTLHRGRDDRNIINALKADVNDLAANLQTAYSAYLSIQNNHQLLLDHLEFHEEDVQFYDALKKPMSEEGLITVGKSNKAVQNSYLMSEWIKGKAEPGSFSDHDQVKSQSGVWAMSLADRSIWVKKWQNEIAKDLVEEVVETGIAHDTCQARICAKFNEKTSLILKSKRIIACTTTAAAKYRSDIIAASPNVVLVEEAGEILESHILTSLCPETAQLVLIGDHKSVASILIPIQSGLICYRQLRPKVNNYQLTVEKGDGYDLNRSIFERLVLKGYPHYTLEAQHRMRPEISALVRELTYPDLVDAPRTQGRSNIHGLQTNVTFINHAHREDKDSRVADRQDDASTSSKQNSHEAHMVLGIVRYLTQQGYGTDQMVVLTPYLGQLRLLQDMFRNSHNTLLNDLDKFDLMRAGLLPDTTAMKEKKSIRLATIGETIIFFSV